MTKNVVHLPDKDTSLMEEEIERKITAKFCVGESEVYYLPCIGAIFNADLPLIKFTLVTGLGILEMLNKLQPVSRITNLTVTMEGADLPTVEVSIDNPTNFDVRFGATLDELSYEIAVYGDGQFAGVIRKENK